MIVNKDLLSTLLEEYPSWRDSAADFLLFIAMIDLMEQLRSSMELAGPLNVSAYGDELAELFLRHTEVNISPYGSFRELKENCVPDRNPAKYAFALLDKARKDVDFYDALEDAGAMPSEDTMAWEILSDLAARKVIRQLSPYVTFI